MRHERRVGEEERRLSDRRAASGPNADLGTHPPVVLVFIAGVVVGQLLAAAILYVGKFYA